MNLGWSGVIAPVSGAAMLLVTAAAALAASVAPAPQFVEPADGATVTSPLVIRFRIADAETGPGAMKPMPGMTAAPHVHLIVDSPPPDPGAMVPSDSRHRHFLHGERQTTLPLPPCDHTLQLVIAAANHRIGTPPVASQRITVHIVAKSAARGSAGEVAAGRVTQSPDGILASAKDLGG
jgi:Domain of unknown function (DUF4399)